MATRGRSAKEYSSSNRRALRKYRVRRWGRRGLALTLMISAGVILGWIILPLLPESAQNEIEQYQSEFQDFVQPEGLEPPKPTVAPTPSGQPIIAPPPVSPPTSLGVLTFEGETDTELARKSMDIFERVWKGMERKKAKAVQERARRAMYPGDTQEMANVLDELRSHRDPESQTLAGQLEERLKIRGHRPRPRDFLTQNLNGFAICFLGLLQEGFDNIAPAH